MQTNRGEVHSPAQWFLIACGGDLVLKVAHDLNVGEDPTGALILNPPADEGMICLSREVDHLALRVTMLNMTLSIGGERSVQYLAIDDDRAVQIHLPSNTLALAGSLFGVGSAPNVLDVTVRPATIPSITAERMVLTGEHPGIPDLDCELYAPIGPLIEADAIRDVPDEPRRDHPPLPREATGVIDRSEPEQPLAPRSGRTFRRIVMGLLGIAAALIALPLGD